MKTPFALSIVLATLLTHHGFAADPRLEVRDQLAESPRIDSSLVSSPTTVFKSDLKDYDLYVADPSTATGWFIRWSYADGDVILDGPFTTEAAADDHLMFMMFGGYDPRDSLANDEPYPSATIVEAPTEPDWMLFGTYDTYEQAADQAAWFEAFGALTRIESRWILQSALRR